jgi:hypothetical protein
MDRDEPAAATTRCGAQHPRRSEVSCTEGPGHARWAHEWSTMRVEGTVLVWETVAWVDLPDADERIERILAKRRARLEALTT